MRLQWKKEATKQTFREILQINEGEECLWKGGSEDGLFKGGSLKTEKEEMKKKKTREGCLPGKERNLLTMRGNKSPDERPRQSWFKNRMCDERG